MKRRRPQLVEKRVKMVRRFKDQNDKGGIKVFNWTVILVTLGLAALLLMGAINQGGYDAFIPNAQEGTISVYDSNDQGIIRTIKVGETVAHGIAVTPDGRHLYTGVLGGEEILVMDPLSGEKIATIDVEPPIHGIDISPDGRYVVIGQIPQVIDTKENEVVAIFDLPEPLARLAHLRFSPDGKRIYIGARPADDGGFRSPETSVVVGNMEDFSVEARWYLRGAYTSTASHDSSYLYVVTYLDRATLTVLDADTGVLLRQAPAGKNSHDVAISPDDRYIWIASRGVEGVGNGIFIFDAENNWELTQKIDLPQPNHLAFSPDGEQVFVTDLMENSLVIFEVDTFKELRRIKIGREPHEIAFLRK